MNTEPHASVLYTDRERIQQILEILPEKAVREFANELLSGARYHGRYNQMLDEYEEKVSKSKLFAFDDSELQRRYKDLDLVIAALDFMRANHFFPAKNDFFELYPDTGGAKDTELRKLRSGKRTEVEELGELLTEKYNALLIQSRKSSKAVIPEHITKMEITAMPELQMRSVEDANAITKGQLKVYPPKFKPTDWAKIEMRFVDDRNVIITTDKKERVVADYQSLGFADEKRDKPNTAWQFLRGLADSGGATEVLPTPIPDTIKQHKRHLADGLRKLFKNDTDPFHDPTDTRTYIIKINLIPPMAPEQADKLGLRGYISEKTEE